MANADLPRTKAVPTTLENLLPELQLQLLSMLDFEELKALIPASPVFHSRYRLDRRYVLCKFLDRTLRSVAVDAYFVYQSGVPGFLATRSTESVVQLVKSYQYQRSSSQYSISAENLSEEEAVSMVDFLSSVIQPFVRHFTSWALANLAKETGSYQDQPLSKTEEIRIMRALYRYQLCCNLFVLHYSQSREDLFGDLWNPDDILQEFMNLLFEPWEIEEIVCIYAFAIDKCDKVFDDIGWGQRDSSGLLVFDFPRRLSLRLAGFFQDHDRVSYLSGTVTRGLEILHTILFKPRTHAQLVLIMQENITTIVGNFFVEFEGFLDNIEQMLFRFSRESERDQKMQRRDPLPFQGDSEPDVKGQRPPLAWTLIWQNTYSNLYGYYISPGMRLWGYVMWDAVRLEQTGAKDVLIRQFAARNPRGDPRDELDYQQWGNEGGTNYFS